MPLVGHVIVTQMFLHAYRLPPTFSLRIPLRPLKFSVPAVWHNFDDDDVAHLSYLASSCPKGSSNT